MPLPSATCRPPLTVGLAVYNGERFVATALDSLLGQTYGDFELIVSDNASTDQTPAIVQDYAARDRRIVYVRHERNQGAAWNFNYVAQRSDGKYFKWAAADDLCAPTFLERCLEVLDGDSSIVCCHARTRKIDAQGEMLTGYDDPTDGGLPSSWFSDGSTRRHRPDASSTSVSRRFADVLLHSGWAVRSSGVMRTSALRQTSLIRFYYGSEKVMMAELAFRGRFYDVPETLFYQRVHEQASSRLVTAAGRQQFIGASQDKRSPRWRLWNDYRQALAGAPLSWSQKIACWTHLLTYPFQFHKWPRLLSAALAARREPKSNALAAADRAALSPIKSGT